MSYLVNYLVVIYLGVYFQSVLIKNENSKLCPTEEALIKAGLIDVESLGGNKIRVDLKYSGIDNFLGKDIYGCLDRAYLQPEVARKLKRASDKLQKEHSGFVLLVYDAARPSWAQQALWDNIDKPENVKHVYVADPKLGSIHNYGAAIDLTIADQNGIPLDMGTPYDYFGILAQPRCETACLKKNELSLLQVSNRKLLRRIMTSSGFQSISSEWWHFNFCSLKMAKSKYVKLT